MKASVAPSIFELLFPCGVAARLAVFSGRFMERALLFPEALCEWRRRPHICPQIWLQLPHVCPVYTPPVTSVWPYTPFPSDVHPFNRSVHGSSASGKLCVPRGSWEANRKCSHAPTALACPTCAVYWFSEEWWWKWGWKRYEVSACRSIRIDWTDLNLVKKRTFLSILHACMCVGVYCMCLLYNTFSVKIFSKEPITLTCWH